MAKRSSTAAPAGIYVRLSKDRDGASVALDRQERGQGELSATQELTRDYGIPVGAIAGLSDILATLAGRPEHRGDVERMEEYRRRYGAAR